MGRDIKDSVYKTLPYICLFLRFAERFDWGIRWIHGNVLSLVDLLRNSGFQAEMGSQASLLIKIQFVVCTFE